METDLQNQFLDKNMLLFCKLSDIVIFLCVCIIHSMDVNIVFVWKKSLSILN